MISAPVRAVVSAATWARDHVLDMSERPDAISADDPREPSTEMVVDETTHKIAFARPSRTVSLPEQE